jgi:NTE family protein
LVLGGGGAKGAAHVGVLEVLDELRVPVDCVTGTSMGALVGGTLAAGNSPADIARAVREINWSRTLGSEGIRARTPIQRKLDGITYMSNLEVGVKDGGLRFPSGLLKTQDIEDVIRSLVAGGRDTRDFDELPIPFRAVATDMLNGEMVVLDSGDLAVALRASMAVPGVFAPVVLDDRVLSDGGMMRNLPVDIARNLCADVVIAVSLASPPPTLEDLNTATALASRSLDVMIDANQKAQIASLADHDISIVIPMGDIGSAAFERVPDAIPLGRKAALAKSHDLRRLALPEAEYVAWRTSVEREGQGRIRLAEVHVEGLQRVDSAYVHEQMQRVAPGQEVTQAEIIEDTARIYALGDFQQVSYSISGPPEARELIIHAEEKSLGPDFVRFDLGFSADGQADLAAVLRAEHTRTWLNARGAAWNNLFQLGEQWIVETDLYQPLDFRQRFFVQPIAHYERNLEDLYVDGDRIATYSISELFGQLDLGMNLGTRAQLRAGIRRGWFETELDTGPAIFEQGVRENDASTQLRLIYDTRDSVGMPTQGTFLNARFVTSGALLGGEQSYDLAEGAITQSFPFRGDSLSLILAGGWELDGDLPETEQFQIGGIRTFPGLRRGELRGDRYWIAGTSYFWKLADIQPLFGQALYAGVRLQGGRMDDRVDQLDEGALYGVSASIGGRTPLGPFLMSLGWVDNTSWQLQLGIGRPLAEGSILDEIR